MTNEYQVTVLNSSTQKEQIIAQNVSEANKGDNPVVNLANGRLQCVVPDLSIGHGTFSIEITHIYNSILNQYFAQKCNNVGSGWKLNLQQVLISDNFTSTGKKVVKFMDATGEIHRFVNFDGYRYYDDRNAKTVLYYSDTQKYIVDGVGNKMQFDSKGYLVKSISCENSKIAKIYEYNDLGQLVKVYDERSKLSTGRIKNYIQLEYNQSGLLSAMTSVCQFSKKYEGLFYSYGEDGSLINISRTIYGKDNQPGAQQTVLQCQYSDGLLTRTINPEEKTSFALEYDGQRRVTSVKSEIIVTDGVALGTTDSQSSSITSMGGIECGTFENTKYLCKTFKTFTYNTQGMSDGLSFETDISNEKGTTLTYFINRDGCVVSSFEKQSSGNLKTLNKQGAQTPYQLTGDVSTEKINGRNSFSVKDGFFMRRLDLSGEGGPSYSVSRNTLDKKSRNYAYTFWLKSLKSYDRLWLYAKIIFKDSESVSIPVQLDEQAQNVWQLVTIPFSLQMDDDGNPLHENIKSISIQFYADGMKCLDDFIINEVGYAPSSRTEMYLATSAKDNFFNFALASKVKINNVESIEDNRLATETYFTENDVVCTFTNKYAHPYSYQGRNCYDIICNAGRKRIANVYNLQFQLIQNSWSVDTATVPFKFKIYTTMDGIGNETLYSFSDKIITIENKSINPMNIESSIKTEMDFKGKTLKTTDEYGVSKVYSYDQYGNTSRVQLMGSDGACGSTISYFYDSEGRLVSSNDGTTGQDITYDQFGNVVRTTETNYVSDYFTENNFESSTHSTTMQYGVYRDKVIRVRESAEDTDENLTNEITYENGKLRTVKDAYVKYGMRYKPAEDAFEYTQFDGNVETTVQRNVKTKQASGDEIHSMQFFNDNGHECGNVSTKVDKYGKVLSVNALDSNGGVSAVASYDYPVEAESRYVVKPNSRYDYSSGRKADYYYDCDGNMIGWDESITSSADKLTVRQLSDVVTKYNFSDGFDYFTEVEYDSEKSISPRIATTYIKRDESNQYDDPKELDRISYTYDNFGRLIKKGDCKIYYKPVANSYVLGGENFDASISYVLKNGDMVNGESKYFLTYRYNKAGDVVGIDHSYAWNVKYPPVMLYNCSGECEQKFAYDKLHRIIRESNSAMDISNSYQYSDGRLYRVVDKYGNKKTYTYDGKGRLSAVGKTRFAYDNYGNRIRKDIEEQGITETYTYESGDKLVAISNGKTTRYSYNSDGVRCSKTVDGKTTQFFLDGNKLLGENRGTGINSDKIRYFYNAEGLHAMLYDGMLYKYFCDSFGNVLYLLNSDNLPVARYQYDMWGNCKVYNDENQEDTNEMSVGNINPFRWKGFYFDSESGLYYANGSYYDPAVGVYLDAAPITTVFDNAFNTRSLDRNSIISDNILELACNPYTISTTTELRPDPDYDAYAMLPWWTKASLWLKKAMAELTDWFNSINLAHKVIIGLVFLALAIVLTIATGCSAVPVVAEVIAGVVIGVGVWALTTLISGQQLTWSGCAQAAIDSFLFSALFAFVSQYVNFVKYCMRDLNKTFVISCSDDLAVRAESYRKWLNQNGTLDKSRLKFATVVYDRKVGAYYYAYNSEIVGMTKDMLHYTLRDMGVRTSCAEIQAVNKALNAGSKLKNLYIYTVNVKTGSWAYACRTCTNALDGRVAKILTGTFLSHRG